MATAAMSKSNARKWQETLAALKDQLAKTKNSYRDAVSEYLLLAQMFVQAEEAAVSLGDAIENRTDRTAFIDERKAEVVAALGVTGKSQPWLSNLRTVAKHATMFEHQRAMLPPATESLLVMARVAAKQGEAVVSRKLRDGVIHPEMSITEVRKAFGKKTRHSVKRGKTIDATLSFSNEDDAIRILAEALRDTDASVRLHDAGDKGVRGGLKAEFSKDWWDTHGHRVS